jgi:hypothetical protein
MSKMMCRNLFDIMIPLLFKSWSKTEIQKRTKKRVDRRLKFILRNCWGFLNRCCCWSFGWAWLFINIITYILVIAIIILILFILLLILILFILLLFCCLFLLLWFLLILVLLNLFCLILYLNCLTYYFSIVFIWIWNSPFLNYWCYNLRLFIFILSWSQT